MTDRPTGAALDGADVARVVLVDDDADVHTLVRAVIGRAGGRLSLEGTAFDAATAMAMVAEKQPDAVLVDLQLGGDRGADLVGPLLQVCPTTMVAAFSALPASEHEAELRRLGAFAYYPKEDIADLPWMLLRDYALFRRALAGEDVLAPAACANGAS